MKKEQLLDLLIVSMSRTPITSKKILRLKKLQENAILRRVMELQSRTANAMNHAALADIQACQKELLIALLVLIQTINSKQYLLTVLEDVLIEPLNLNIQVEDASTVSRK
jgi:hypothetical protein